MHRLRASLPSANVLFTFEAAARRRSFTAAAEELNVSQPAVSKMIRQFEASLGFRLFHRDTRPLELTAEGKRLFQEVERSFDSLHGTIQSMRQGVLRETVRAAFSASFIQLWLLPRLPDFHDRHPGISLSLEESSQEDFDLYSEGLDLSSRLGFGEWPDLEARFLVPEVIFPVAHPARATEAEPRLLHFRERHRVRFGWGDWFTQVGRAPVRDEEKVVFADALGSLGAAASGHGMAIGWAHLVLDAVRQGRLAPVGERRITTGKAIWLVNPRKRPLGPAAQAFANWVVQRMRADMAQDAALFQMEG